MLRRLSRKRFRTMFLILFIAVAVAQSVGQSTSRPPFDAFEVASIKPTSPDYSGGVFITMQGPRQFVVRNYTVKRLLSAAYNLPLQAISGGPSWIDSVRYDVLAATPGDVRPTTDEQMAMLRQLLTDRFNLTFHREQRESSVYTLNLTPNGPKLKASTAPADDPPFLINRMFPGRVFLPARNVTMPQFVSMLQRSVLDRPVLDRTGLLGRYDFDLDWLPDETQFGGAFRSNPSPTDVSDRPSLFTALQEQLGLKLEATRGYIQVLVIDKVDRPSEG